jgi:hypothetical protein
MRHDVSMQLFLVFHYCYVTDDILVAMVQKEVAAMTKAITNNRSFDTIFAYVCVLDFDDRLPRTLKVKEPHITASIIVEKR